eukprot:TRINITY_DN20275_c0_g1_i1.p1 TRINITY_DN20275_c0_g1~~TRINITY_DN20275_c0_g1_i1.p1  ORF type:complete len:437 (+),score=109.90 TRINITY_DN20275_c0_g1_i1:226-1536(+)
MGAKESKLIQSVRDRQKSMLDSGSSEPLELRLIGPHGVERPLDVFMDDKLDKPLLTIPKKVFELDHLSLLDVSNNALENVPSSIRSLRHLKQLVIAGNPIECVSDGIGELSDTLEIFIAKKCGPKLRLPQDFGQLRRLKHLDLSLCLMEDLYPIDMFKSMDELVFLDLSFNKLSRIPPYVGTLPKLRTLMITGNAIRIIPNLPECLSVLNIGVNELTAFEESLLRLSQLEELDIGDNMIHEMPKSLRSMKSLKKLRLSDNSIESLGHSLIGLTLLEDLEASSCGIQHLLDGTFISLRQMVRIDLSDNYIDSIPNEFFDMRLLKTIDLKHNRLKILPDKFDVFHKLEKLALDGNPVEDLPLSIENFIECGICTISRTFVAEKRAKDDAEHPGSVPLAMSRARSIANQSPRVGSGRGSRLIERHRISRTLHDKHMTSS